ncbi:MAG: cobalamin-dependent protein, partial [Proteobacteria bacterium]|nr:cobalamin-dependent protein [Pseudomonadota bacterium]
MFYAGAAVLGFSTVCDSYPHTVQIAQRYKEMCKGKDKNAIIVLGGPQASAVDLETLTNFPFIDFIVRGEGELTFSEVIEKLETCESFADVRGITYREKVDGSTKIKRNPDRELIPDLDSLPIPAYHLYPISENSDEIPLDIGR